MFYYHKVTKNISINLLTFNYLHALLAKFLLKFKQLLNCIKATYNEGRDFQQVLIATLESLNITK